MEWTKQLKALIKAARDQGYSRGFGGYWESSGP
jgi:hypothetical protein